jgi:hypothetical protein
MANPTAESLKRHKEWLDLTKCKCDYVYKIESPRIDSFGGWLRMTTHPKCPEHALCQGYTFKVRAKEWNGEWLYCNVHGRKNCPK